jgi:RNA polymerase sigma factor (sigma-70 family)
LETLDPRQARIVKMRCFGGLTIEQTAEALGLSDDTVKREWTHARAWLRLELSQRPS